jgi:hypothetical protein
MLIFNETDILQDRLCGQLKSSVTAEIYDTDFKVTIVNSYKQIMM